jgi:hypothetical protein
MPFDYKDILIHQESRLQGQRAQALAELEASRVREDVEGVNMASDDILRIDRDLEELNRYASNYVRQNQVAAPRNKYNLSDDEVELAHGIAGNDHSLTKEDRERIYAEQKQKLGHMRATGAYRDDQGRVGR